MVFLDVIIAVIAAFVLLTLFVGVSRRVQDMDRVVAVILIINLAVVIAMKYFFAAKVANMTQ